MSGITQLLLGGGESQLFTISDQMATCEDWTIIIQN